LTRKGSRIKNLRFGEFQVIKNENNVKLHQSGGEIGIPFPSVFAYVPWKHHVEIVAKSKSIDGTETTIKKV